jgi:zinc transport system substrate-binding protein
MSQTIGKMKGVSFFIILTVFLIIVAVMGIGMDYWRSGGEQASDMPDHEHTVVATLFPYFDMARSLAGEQMRVVSLLPPGVSPHHYEPKPSDIRLVADADVFIYTGPMLEPWAEDVLKSAVNPNLKVVNASQHSLVLLAGTEGDDHEARDPHIWLDADNAVSILHAIRDALTEADPSSAQAYEDRALMYESELASMDETYRKSFDLCRTRTFVEGGHRSFGYIARRYNLDYYATTGVDDTEEPTANDLAGLATLVREKALPYVFYDTFGSPRTAEVIARESESGILTLNPGATVSRADMESGATFFDIMESNLRNLSLALECQ